MEDRNISFLDYTGELEDPRIERGKLHSMGRYSFFNSGRGYKWVRGLERYRILWKSSIRRT